MKLGEALQTAHRVIGRRQLTVEQIRMGSPEDRGSYIVIIRRPDGNVVQIDKPEELESKLA